MDGDIDIWITYEQALPYYAKKDNVDLDDVDTVLKL